jgi:UDPglucose 6-dehydrogenase
MKTKIVIIGMGFVGGAVHASLETKNDVTVSVIDPNKGFMTSYQEIKDYDAAFVCVPSPSLPDGTCDVSILKQVLYDLHAVDFRGTIISKVTAPPSVYKELQDRYINLVHAPEFLTAANAIHDYLNGRFAIIGSKLLAYKHEAERIIKISQPYITRVVHCSIAEASLAKYAINSFLATKVVFMNELHSLSENLDCEWESVVAAITQDTRIGQSHMQVPGPDGDYGFGGHCFPKDTAALLKQAEQADVNLNVLDAAVKKNLIIKLTNDD